MTLLLCGAGLWKCEFTIYSERVRWGVISSEFAGVVIGITIYWPLECVKILSQSTSIALSPRTGDAGREN